MMQQKELLYILISSTVLTFIWIGSTLYHAHVTSTIEEPLTTLIQPISHQFNTQAIQQIMSRTETIPTYDLSGERRTTSPTPSLSPIPREEEPSTTPTSITPTETPVISLTPTISTPTGGGEL